VDKNKFEWPEDLPEKSLDEFMDPQKGSPMAKELKQDNSPSGSQERLQDGLADLLQRKAKPWKEPWVMDIDSGRDKISQMLDCSPCLLKSRPKGYYMTNRFRRYTLGEMFRLQGIDPSSIEPVGSRTTNKTPRQKKKQ